MAYQSLHDRLQGPIKESLKKELGIKNDHALPALKSVIVSTGINKSKMDSKETHKYVAECMASITGQRPVFTKSRKSISNFKTREGMVVGAMVTLRGKSMENFLDRLLSYSLPRIRDFQGLKTKLDGHGGYSIGLKDHSIFVELPPVDANQIFGLQIQICTTADNDKDALALLKLIGFPFKKTKQEEKDAEEAAKKADSSVDSSEETPNT